MTIPALWPIKATVRPWNERLYELLRKEREGTITAPEQLELNKRFLAMETEQDNLGEQA